MSIGKWVLLIVFAISALCSICICPYLIHNSELRKTRRIAEHLQSLFGGIVVGVLTSILYQTLSK